MLLRVKFMPPEATPSDVAQFGSEMMVQDHRNRIQTRMDRKFRLLAKSESVHLTVW